MRIATYIWRQHVFSMKRYTIKGDYLSCVNASGEKHKIALKDVIWISDGDGKKKSSRLCFRVKEDISGTQVKKLFKHELEGFATAVLADGSKLSINKRLHRLYKDDNDESR